MSLLFVVAFDELTDKITQFITNIYLIPFSIYAVNFIVLLQTTAKFLQIYRGYFLLLARYVPNVA